MDSESQTQGERDATAIASLTAEVARLKVELDRLREELRRSRRSEHETPPHYL